MGTRRDIVGCQVFVNGSNNYGAFTAEVMRFTDDAPAQPFAIWLGARMFWMSV